MPISPIYQEESPKKGMKIVIYFFQGICHRHRCYLAPDLVYSAACPYEHCATNRCQSRRGTFRSEFEQNTFLKKIIVKLYLKTNRQGYKKIHTNKSFMWLPFCGHWSFVWSDPMVSELGLKIQVLQTITIPDHNLSVYKISTRSFQ